MSVVDLGVLVGYELQTLSESHLPMNRKQNTTWAVSPEKENKEKASDFKERNGFQQATAGLGVGSCCWRSSSEEST
jgi:hypothetical protein